VIVGLDATVLFLLGAGRLPKIAPTIVGRIVVDVIYLVNWI
jgi:hypothetical protein